MSKIYPIPRKYIGTSTEILGESSQFLFCQFVFHLQEVVQHCEQQNGNPSTSLACLYGPKVHGIPQNLSTNWPNLDAFTPTFISLGPYVGSMSAPILETRQPIPRSLVSESRQQHIEGNLLRLVLDRGSRRSWTTFTMCSYRKL